MPAIRSLIALAMLAVVGQTAAVWAAQPPDNTQHVHQGRYLGLKLARVSVKTPAHLDAVRHNSVEILADYAGLKPLDVVVTRAQLDALRAAGLTVQVTHTDLQDLVDAEFERSRQVRGDPFEDWFLDYHRYDDGEGSILWYMNELIDRYPALASLVYVGDTLEGQAIYGLRITNDAVPGNKPAVVYFSAEHAREWITPTVTMYFATHLLEEYGGDLAVTDLVDHVEFFLIPVMNIDGYEYSWTTYRLWRKNRRDNGDGTWGVDLNRNWAEGWGGPGSSGYTDDPLYRGPSPFSEPETQVMRDFFINHTNVRAQLDIHSYSQLILWPYGYQPDLPEDQDVYQEIGSAMAALIYEVHGETYSATSTYTGYGAVSGCSMDWTYAQLGILSYAYECRDTGYYGFELPADQIIPQNEELLPATLHLSNSEWVRAAIRFEFPNGVPSTITAGSDTSVAVNVIGQSESVLPGSPTLHYRYDPSGAFADVPLTSLGGDSYEGILPATNCWSEPEFYFSAEGDGGTTQTNPASAPGAGVYTAAVASSSAVFFEELMDTNPGWTLQSQWAWGQPTGDGGEYGGPDPTSGYTGDNVYGYNLTGDYANNLSERHLTTPAIDCSDKQGVNLSFWRWLGVEQPSYDHAYVRVSNNGSDWHNVWQNTTEVTDYSWAYQEFDISAYADNQPTVYVRWTMGTTDSGWRYCGWNVDDVRLTAAGCEGALGDYNGDESIDLEDAAELAPCLTGPEGGVLPGCTVFDFLGDEDVDLADYAAFENAFDGS
jgi:hypothetical protein